MIVDCPRPSGAARAAGRRSARSSREVSQSLRQIEEDGSLALAFSGGKPTRPVIEGAVATLRRRLAWMAKHGIDKQVVRRLGRHGSATSCRRAEGEAWCAARSTTRCWPPPRPSRISCRSPRVPLQRRRARRRRAEGRHQGGLCRRHDRARCRAASARRSMPPISTRSGRPPTRPARSSISIRAFDAGDSARQRFRPGQRASAASPTR